MFNCKDTCYKSLTFNFRKNKFNNDQDLKLKYPEDTKNQKERETLNACHQSSKKYH